jgi:hypothetical protein
MSYYDFLAQAQTNLKLDCSNVEREFLKALRNGEISDEQTDHELLDLQKTKEHTEQLCNAIQEIMYRVKPYTYAEYIAHIHHKTHDISRLLVKRMYLHQEWSRNGQPNQLNELRAKYKELQDLMTIHRKLIDKLVEPAEQNSKLLRDRSPTVEEKNTFEKQLENDINEMKQ